MLLELNQSIPCIYELININLMINVKQRSCVTRSFLWWEIIFDEDKSINRLIIDKCDWTKMSAASQSSWTRQSADWWRPVNPVSDRQSVGLVLTRTESDLLDPLLQLNWVSSVQWVQLACFGPGRAVCPGWVRAGQPRRTTALIRWPPRAIRPGGRPGPARPAHWPSRSENQKSSVNVSRLIPADGRRFIVT